MYTINIVHDLANPNKHTLTVPVNTPFCVVAKFKVYDLPLEFGDNWQFIPLINPKYRPIMVNGEWVNNPQEHPELVDTTFMNLAGNPIEYRGDGEFAITCSPGYTSRSIALYVAKEAGGHPNQWLKVYVDLNFVERCENNPTNGGITLTGEYEDGTQFNFSVNALDNSVQEPV